MAIKKSQLYSMLWESCNQLRGGMDASQYKNYILVLLFVKYMSDRQKAGEDMLEPIPQGCTFDDMCRWKYKKEIGEKIDMMLDKWGRAFNLTGVLDKASFQDESNLGKGKDLVKTVSKLLGVFQDSGLDFSANRADDDDLIGDAYEYLMKNFAAESGKSKGQFYTPAEVSRLMAVLIGINKDTRTHVSIYDPACGSGSLLLRAKAAYMGNKETCNLFGQEKDIASVNMAKMNTFLHGDWTADIANDDTLNSPFFKDDNGLRTFDYVVANPPFSLKSWRKGASLQDFYGRWGLVRKNRDGRETVLVPTPPENCGDYAFLLHILHSMDYNRGKGACILPHGVLFRGNTEADIRRWLVKERYIQGIIGLPANLFFGTGIPACIILLDKENVRTRKGIFMIDAKDGFVKAGAKNRLREQDIRHICDVWNEQTDIPNYAHLATWKEIEKHDYNLNLSRYITPLNTDIIQDVDAHLHGGIPKEDTKRLDMLWVACPKLHHKLLKERTDRFVYFDLRCKPTEVLDIILKDKDYIAQEQQYSNTLDTWLQNMRRQWMSLQKGCSPKQMIAQWSDDLLNVARRCGLLMDIYEVYDQLMNYYNDIMQDDLFLIATNGWEARATVPLVKTKKKMDDENDDAPQERKEKKTYTYKELVTDLVPVSILVSEYFAKEQNSIEQCEQARDAVIQLQNALLEEFEEDFDESFFPQQKFNKANLKAALKQAVAENKEYMRSVILHWQDWLRMDDEAAKIKADINKRTKKLTTAVMDKYSRLTETEVKHLVVDVKWNNDLMQLWRKQLLDKQQTIVSELADMYERYEFTLPQLEEALEEDRAKVRQHLMNLGYL